MEVYRGESQELFFDLKMYISNKTQKNQSTFWNTLDA